MSAVVPLYIKTAYHDEPSFANTKVVTSLFTNGLSKNFGENFKQGIEFRDANAEVLAGYNDTFDYNELSKLAIDFSDGVIQGHADTDPALMQYAKDKNIPVLGYCGDDFADAFESFYDQICPDTEE
jgi:starch synthase